MRKADAEGVLGREALIGRSRQAQQADAVGRLDREARRQVDAIDVLGKTGAEGSCKAASADGRLPLLLYARLFGKPEPAILADRVRFRFRVLAQGADVQGAGFLKLAFPAVSAWIAHGSLFLDRISQIDYFLTGIDAHLPVNVRRMGFHGIGGYDELVGDALNAVSACQQE